MLPTFRPAMLGRDAPARPVVRSAKATPPQPPPAPPRRNASGLVPRGTTATPRLAEAIAHDPDGLWRTLAADKSPDTMPRELFTARRECVDATGVSFDAETRAHTVDDSVLDELRGAFEPAPAPHPADFGVEYDSLPSFEVRRPYDTYEADSGDREPVTQLKSHRHAMHPRANAAVSADRSYDETLYPEVSQERRAGRRDEPSGRRERPLAIAETLDAASSAYESLDYPARRPAVWANEPPDGIAPQPMIPPAPRVPDSMRPAFVVGVQPVRNAALEAPAWRTPPAFSPPFEPPLPITPKPVPPMATAPMHAVRRRDEVYRTPTPAATRMSATPRLAEHFPAHVPAQQVRVLASVSQTPRVIQPIPLMAPSTHRRAQPVGAQLTEALSVTGKFARISWFVAGSALGVMFALFGTGFLSVGRPADVTPLTAAPSPTAPMAVAPVAPPASALALAAMSPTSPLVAAAPVAAVPVPAVPVASVAAVPVASAPPPRRMRAHRSAGGASLPSPKVVGGAVPSADDEVRPAVSPPPSPSPPPSDVGDLLGDGLKP